jgi:hypothetical protein
MKKSLTLIAFATLFAVQSFAATYVVVLKDGTRYAAKAKWTIVNGKALVKLENGQSLQFDPALIDVAMSERMTKVGMASASVVDLDPTAPQKQPARQESLGSAIKLRRTQEAAAPPVKAAPSAATPVVPSGSGAVPDQALNKFMRAFENIGIFDSKITSTGGRSMRAEMTVDTEERVFNAISATSFLMVRNAGVDGAQIDLVELFMKTTNGGTAGRFQMSRADAEALDKRTISQQDYFIRKVIY